MWACDSIASSKKYKPSLVAEFPLILLLITGSYNKVSVQVCVTCIRCKSCGVTPGKSWDTDWNHDKGLCPDCSKLYELGEDPPCYML